MDRAAVEALVLRRLMRVPVASANSTHTRASAAEVRAAALELAHVGRVPSNALVQALSTLSTPELTTWTQRVCASIAEVLGAAHTHIPLFRSFPRGIPDDTEGWWWKQVVVHYLQNADEPCLTCGRVGCTHVLQPCAHVVCDHCFDGSSLSACPICGKATSRTSPFFQPSPPAEQPVERVRFVRIDVLDDLDAAARSLFIAFCSRPQVMSPVDVSDLVTIVTSYGLQVLSWLPPAIPVKENVAHVFGTLLRFSEAAHVLPVTSTYLRTATDVLRVIAAMSGADPSLQATPTTLTLSLAEQRLPRWTLPPQKVKGVTTPVRKTISKRRFAVAKLPRPVRRALLTVLAGFNTDALVEDMLRHQSLWVWVGKFLHPHEHADRWPQVARAFAVVREHDDGAGSLDVTTWAARVEGALAALDVAGAVSLLQQRPGEFARRLDHVLRLCTGTEHSQIVVDAFTTVLDRLPTPLLLTLSSVLRTRTAPQAVRLVFPRGKFSSGMSLPPHTQQLTLDVVDRVVGRVEQAVLGRWSAQLPALGTVVVDRALDDVIVPFNERTASRGAVALTRGSRLQVPSSKTARMFLHWCEPEHGGQVTDVDLSVAFYDSDWQYVGVCSYYQLQCTLRGDVVARSSGDLRHAPFPDGASEFVDVDRLRAVAGGARYAAMVVNNYAGMAFGTLERAFAGLMLRDDVEGAHFDPRTVLHRFDLQGENGVYLPLVFDLHDDCLYWLDVYARGQLAMNNVATSNSAVTRLASESIAYFGSGARLSMLQLGLLHGAARAQRVVVRDVDGGLTLYERGDDDAVAFLQRLRSQGGLPTMVLGDGAAVLALLLEGDLAVPEGSAVWVLLPGTTASTLAAADLLP
jgi:hypothetical protein